MTKITITRDNQRAEMIKLATTLSVDDLKKQILSLNDVFEGDHFDLVFDVLIEVLMTKTIEREFVEFCKLVEGK